LRKALGHRSIRDQLRVLEMLGIDTAAADIQQRTTREAHADQLVDLIRRHFGPDKLRQMGPIMGDLPSGPGLQLSGLTVTGKRDTRNVSNGFTVACMEGFPLPEEWPRDVGPHGAYAWALKSGAQDTHSSKFRVFLEGSGDATVTILGVRSIIQRRTAASIHRYAIWDSAGVNEAVGLFFNLDEDECEAHEIVNEDHRSVPGPAYFSPRYITVAPGEVVILDVVGRATAADSIWHLDLDLFYMGREVTARIDNGGHPFRTVPWDPEVERVYWKWWAPGLPVGTR